MKKIPSEEYLERAKQLSREEAEKILSRMRNRLTRRIEDREFSPLEAVALQLQKEDEDLREWREKWAEITEREKRKKGK
jgi:hypothetical protein